MANGPKNPLHFVVESRWRGGSRTLNHTNNLKTLRNRVVFPHFPFLCTIMHEPWWQNTGIFRRRVSAGGLIHLNLRELLVLCRDMCSTEGHFLVGVMFLFYCIMSTEFKATLASNFRLTMGQLSNVKGVTCNHESTENFHGTLRFPAVLQPLTHCFSSMAYKVLLQQAAGFSGKASTAYYLPNAKHLTGEQNGAFRY